MKRYALTFVVVALICSCAPAGRDVIRVEPNDLGITELEVRHDQVQDDRLLTLRGFDQDGTVIATAVLRTGMVMYGADVPEELHAGTELAVTVGQRTASFVSPDRVPHVIYDPLSPGVATFVRLSPVANEVFREAAIRFAPPQAPSDEVPFTAGACSGSRFPTNKGGSTQCCQDNANTYHVNATLGVANRSTYAPVYPSIPVCRDSAGNTGCTTNCMYGPCGSAVISVKGTNGHVFVPTSNPNVCGWDDGGAGGLGVDYSPEHYTTQTLYGGMTATCQCTGCNSDGTPQCLAAQWKFNESSGTNLVSNPGLETWSGGLPTSWTKTSLTTVTQSSTAHGGSYSAQVQSSDWSKGIAQTVTTTQPSGTTFVGIAWVQWVAGSSQSPYLQLVITYSDGTPTAYVGGANSGFTTSGWYQIAKVYTVSHPVSSVSININNNSGVSQTFLADDASLSIGGITAADSSGNGNSGTLTNGTTFVAGKVGNAVELDGVNDYVAFGNPSVLSFGTTSFSYALWVYEYSATPVGSADMPWWKGGNITGHVGFDMELGTGAWNACLSDAVTVKCSSFSSTPTYDAWVHLVAVVDRTAGQLKVYKNGAYVTQTALSTFGSVSSNWTAEVGAEYDSSKGIASPFHGKVDDVRMYNYALSDSEVSTLYNGGAGQP